MAVVLPIVAAFTAVAEAGGVVAALSAGFASFTAVAGGFLAGAGLLTGNKSLQKLGGMLSLASGVANLASGIANGASAADSASSAWDASGSAAGSDAAQFGKYATDASSAVEGASNAAQAGSSLADAGGTLAGAELASPSMQLTPQGIEQMATAQPAGADLLGTNSSMQTLGAADDSYNLMEQARLARTTADPGLLDAQNRAITLNAQDAALGRASSVPSVITEGAKQINGADHLQSLMDKLKGIGGVLKDNKELALLGGMAVQSVFDPRRDELKYQRSLMEKRRANLNNPIRLTTNGG